MTFVDPAVQKLRESKPQDHTIRLLAEVDGDVEAIKQDIESIAETDVEDLGMDVLLIRANSTQVDRICEVDGVETVEVERGAQPLGGQGN